MKAGDKFEIRIQGRADWMDAELVMVSANGRSLALACARTLGSGGGFILDPISGEVLVLLVREQDEWHNLYGDEACELREKIEL